MDDEYQYETVDYDNNSPIPPPLKQAGTPWQHLGEELRGCTLFAELLAASIRKANMLQETFGKSSQAKPRYTRDPVPPPLPAAKKVRCMCVRIYYNVPC